MSLFGIRMLYAVALLIIESRIFLETPVKPLLLRYSSVSAAHLYIPVNSDITWSDLAMSSNVLHQIVIRILSSSKSHQIFHADCSHRWNGGEISRKADWCTSALFWNRCKESGQVSIPTWFPRFRLLISYIVLLFSYIFLSLTWYAIYKPCPAHPVSLRFRSASDSNTTDPLLPINCISWQ